MKMIGDDETGEFGYPKAGCGLRGLARFTYRNPPGGLGEPTPKKDPEDDSPSPLPTWQRWKMANRRRETGHHGRDVVEGLAVNLDDEARRIDAAHRAAWDKR